MWQINRISKETILNIAKYSNKVIAVARLIQETNQPFVLNNILNVSDQSDQIEILNAFDKDLTKTVNDFFEIQKLLVTVDDNGFVKELENEDKNLNNIFGTFYNQSTKTLSLPTIDLNMNTPSSESDIRDSIIEAVLGFDFKRYKELMRIKENLKDLNKDELFTDNEKINYLVNKTDIDFVIECVNKINAYSNSFITIRKDLNFEEKDLIDSKINSGRTMIDGVLPKSTYISKRGGVYQLSNEHKKDYGDRVDSIVSDISEEIENIGYLSGVEIDQDTDLEKFLFLVQKMNSLNLNVHNEFELKTRKLGNYMANGLCYLEDMVVELMGYYSDMYSIVSVDVNTPSALIHELTHLIDLSNKDFLKSPEREAMVNHFTKKISIPEGFSNSMSSGYKERMFNHKEVIARLGEIGYLLNKVDYQGHSNKEELENYYKKIRMMEMMETIGDKEIPIVHSVDFYRKNAFLYFDIDNLKEEELLAIKEYYKSYYNVVGNDFTVLSESCILANLKKNANREENVNKNEGERERTAKNNRFSKEQTPISKINLENIESVLTYNDQDNIFSNKALAKFLSVNLVDINRSRINEDYLHYGNTFKVIEAVCDYARDHNNKELERELLNAICLKASKSYSRISELNKTVEKSVYRDFYILNNSGFTDRESPTFVRMVRDTIKNIQAKTSGKDPEVSYINLSIRPEIEIDRPLLLEQVKNRLKYLSNFSKDDIFLHKSLDDISNIFKKYAEVIQPIFDMENLNDLKSKPKQFNEPEFLAFSDLLNAALVLDNEQTFSTLKNSIRSTVNNFHRGYTKRPSFNLKFEDFTDDFLLSNFEDLKSNIGELTGALKNNKALQDGATDKQKLSFLSKISFKNFKVDFIIDFIDNIDLNDIKTEKKLDIFRVEDGGRYRYNPKDRLISNFLKNETIGLNNEMASSALNEYVSKYSVLKIEGRAIDSLKIMKDSIKDTVERYIEINSKIVDHSVELLNNNKEVLLFLKTIQNEVIKFMIEKDVVKDYINYAIENKESNISSVRQANNTIRNLFNVSAVNIMQPNAISKLESQIGVLSRKNKI